MQPLCGHVSASMDNSSGAGTFYVVCRCVCPHPVASCVSSGDSPSLHSRAKSATLPSLLPRRRASPGSGTRGSFALLRPASENSSRSGHLEVKHSFLGTLSSQQLSLAGSPNQTDFLAPQVQSLGSL